MVRIRVKNYQSISEATVEVRGFTVVTGSNNCGKSALMRATRGVFQNTKGTTFIRRGTNESEVAVEFDDGRSVVWKKGRGKADKPTYIIDGGPPIHPGQAVPDEVRALGVRPITAGGREVWPQFAPQFTGQVFLLDQPGSVLAEAVADVDRVSQLNEALRLAESDRRAATSDLRTRLGDQAVQEKEVARFEGLDAVAAEVQGIEALAAQAARIERGIVGLTELRDRLDRARGQVEILSGVNQVQVPDVAGLQQMLAERGDLVRLRGRWDAARGLVERLAGIETVGSGPDMAPAEKILTARGVLIDLRARHEAARKAVRDTEEALRAAEAGVERATEELRDMLGDMGSCPLCGSVVSPDHTHRETTP